VNRRGFLAAISVLPFLGWLKPKPEVAMFSNAHESSMSDVNTASGQLYRETETGVAPVGMEDMLRRMVEDGDLSLE